MKEQTEYPLPDNENDRLASLKQYNILDTANEVELDNFTELASQICGTPIALISLIDEDRQWFKSKIGLDIEETSRNDAFCAHTIINSNELLIVEDALQDERFANSSLVKSDPNIRFYAGAPLTTPDGYSLGALCVLDQTPRKLNKKQKLALQTLSKAIITHLELKRTSQELLSSQEKLQKANLNLKNESNELEDRFNQIMSQMNDVAWVASADGSKIYDINQSFEYIYGIPASTFEKNPNLWNEVVHPDDRAIADQSAKNLFNLGKATAEYRIVRPDGSIKWLLDKKAFTYDKEGVPNRMGGIASDITDRKQIEQDLINREQFISDVLNSLSAHIVVIDKEGVILTVNKSWQLFATQNEADHKTTIPVGLNYLTICKKVAETGDKVAIDSLNGIESVRSGSQSSFYLEYPCHSPTERRWFAMRVFPLNSSAGGIVIAHENVTEKILSEETINTKLKQLETVFAINLAIANNFDLTQILDKIIQSTYSQLNADAASILLFKPASNDLEIASAIGFKNKLTMETTLKIGTGLAGQAALNRELIHVTNIGLIENDEIRLPLFEKEDFISYFGIPLIAKGQLKGVLEVFHRQEFQPNSEWLDFFKTLAGQTAIAIEDALTFRELQRSNIKLSKAYDATIEGWSRAMDLRDKETEGHTKRVTELTVKLARKFGLSDEEIVQIRRGALLHDMGKLGIPDDILLKPGKLTDEEWAIMTQHPQYAFEMLAPIDYLNDAIDIPYCHHEKWDGTGYPRGLIGKQIPIAARLFSIVDVWDALRSDRPYRASWSEEKVIEHIKNLSGSHFDPQVVELFLEVIPSSKN